MSEGFISITEFNNLLKELENEKASHLDTKSKLAVTCEKLEFALGEIDILNKQLKKEKEAFHEAFSHLKDTAFEQKYHALQLKQKFEDVERVCDEQDNMLSASESKILDLKGRLIEQKRRHQKQIDDKEIHLIQERYIAQHYLGEPSTSKHKKAKTKSFTIK